MSSTVFEVGGAYSVEDGRRLARRNAHDMNG
jgi:hypothetical protein